jgi:hypothetical protein
MARLLLPPILALGLATSSLVPQAGDATLDPTTTAPTSSTVTIHDLADGHTAEWWEHRAVSNGRTMRARGRTVARLKRTLAGRTTIHEAIALASTVYRVPYSTLNRKAWCESRFSPSARNPSGAMGLFQFLGSTWRTTPFAGFSPYDPLAAALAAGWMHLVGRGGEWSCR